MWNLTATIMVTSPLLWLPRQQSYIAIKQFYPVQMVIFNRDIPLYIYFS